jgi:flagellar basal-body rod protein FlgG
VRLSRNGSFSIDGQGQLVNKEGWPILRQAEPGVPPEQRTIRLPTEGKLVISDNGEILVGEESLGQISLVDVSDPQALTKEGSSTFSMKPNMNAQINNVASPNLRQGFIETSNVNVVQEMTDMITATRLFESTQKAIQAYDSMADKLVNVVPQVR